eukprot:2143696-Ditylum_brightwellii.AAC.1
MVDCTSNFSYSHLIRGASNAEALSAKDAYERVIHSYGHKVEVYHGNISRFDSQDFKDSCNRAQQTYSYCGIGAHHQNDIAEAMNKRLSYSARAILLHTKRKWPSVITSILWPFCYKCADECHNLLDLNSDGLSPVEAVLRHTEELVADDFHTWGCPVFVLNADLQTGHGTGPPKWNPRARTGVYLGHSLMHAGNVALVLNLQTGHVSPQYHEHTEKAADEAFNLASAWYKGEKAAREDPMSQTSADCTLVKKQDIPFIDLDTIGLR